MKFAPYTSGRLKTLKIGISNYSEDLTSLNVIGDVKVGTGITIDSSTGTLIGTKIQIIGGSSNEFLMADGSINSSSFLTEEVDTLNSVLNRGNSSGIGISISGIITATTFKGALDGNAGTATSLATARNIGGVSFDGTADINLPGVNQAGDQDTSGNALTATTAGTVSNAAQTNITSVGTLTSLTVDGDVSIGGTLTYEDVTNVDSIGLVTARTGVRISTGGLVVTGVSTFNGGVTLSENNPTITLSDTNNNPDYQIGNINGVLRFQDTTNNATRIGVSTDGNVGIGTNDPQELLDVVHTKVDQTPGSDDIAVFRKTGTGYLKVLSTNTGMGGIAFGDTDDTFIGALQYNHGDDSMRAYVNNKERLRISSDGDVGIGTTNPGSKLDVRGDITVDSKIGSKEFFSTSFLDFDDDNGTTPFPGSTNNVTLASISGINLIYDTNNNDLNGFMIAHGNPNSGIATAVLVIDANDKVGIGTNTPIGHLDVRDASGSDPTISIHHSNADVEGEFIRVARTDIPTIRYHSIKANHAGSASSNYIAFNIHDGVSTTSQTEVLRVQGDGKIGIGQNNPVTTLEIKSNAHDQTTATIPTIRITNDDGSASLNDITGSVEFFTEDTSDPNHISGFMRNISETNAGVNYSLIFGTKDATITGDATEKLRIQSNGNVGIGSSSPSEKLDVNGPVKATRFVGSASSLTGLTGASAGTFGGSTTSAIITVNSDGKITGISTTEISGGGGGGSSDKIEEGNSKVEVVDTGTGSITFEVDGNERLLINSSGVKEIKNGNLNILSTYIDFSGSISTPSTAAAIYRPADNTLAFSTKNDERLRITSDGNVGISQTDPYYKLHLNFTDNTTALSGGSGGNWGGNGIRIENDSDTVDAMALAHFRVHTADWHIGSKFVSHIGAVDKSDFVFNHEGIEALRITNEGKVGIGTTNPNASLHIFSTGPDILLTDSNQATDNRNWILSGANTQILRLQALNDSYAGGGSLFDFYRSGNNINELRGMKSGNYWFVVSNNAKKVGIGTDDPETILHLHDSANTRIQFTDDAMGAASGDGVIAGLNGEDDFFINNRESGKGIKFFTGTDDERMVINSDGDVGIGTDPVRRLSLFDTDACVLELNSTSSHGTSLRIQHNHADKMLFGLAGDFIVGQANNVTDSAIRNEGALIIATGGGNERLRIDSSGNLKVTGIATFDQNVSIGGTLTYEDVTNIDSVGLVTARSGINVTAGVSTFAAAIDANGGVDISGGSGLVASTAKISDLTDNRVVVAGSLGELEDSANLTFNGSILQVNGQGIFNSVITAKTYIQGVSSNGGLNFYSDSSATAGVILDTDDNLTPITNNVSDLGSSSLKWKNIFAKGDLYVDGKVGIGTNDPSRKLDLHESSSSGNFISITNDTTGHGAADGVLIGMQDNESLLISNKENNHIEFHTNNTEKLRISSDGEVCIAHDSVLHSGNLQVSTAGADAIDINSYSTNTNNGGRLSFYRSKNGSIGINTIVADGDSLGRIDFRGYNSNGNNYNQGATIEARVDGSVNSTTDMPTAILFKTSGDGSASPDERLRITSGGEVGIGSTIPGGVLDLYHATSNTILNVKSGDAGSVINLIDNATRSSIEQNGASLKIISDTAGTYENSDIRLQVDGSTKMLIDSDGNVIVNNTTAAAGSYTYKLLTSDNISSSEQTFGVQYPGVVTYGLNAESNADFTIKKDGAERLRISSDGKVGIGTTGDPTDILDVHKDSTTTYDATDDNAQRTHSASITVRNDNGSTDTFSQLVFDTAGSNQSIARIVALRTGGASNALTFVTEHSNTKAERLRIHSGGNVSIGTTITNERVNIHTASSLKAQVQFTNTTTGTESGDGLVIGITGGEEAIFWNQEETNMAFATNNIERVRIDSDGKFGIGMSSDQKTGGLKGKLDIDASGINAAGDTDDPNDYAIVIRNPQTTDSGNGIAFTNDGGSHVGGAIIHIDRGSNNIGDLAFLTSATTNTPTEKLRITSGGNVGINSTAPLYKLDVRGSVGGFDDLRAPHSDTVKTYTVLVADKDVTHRYQGQGSGKGYKIDGEFSPFITLTPGRTYRFEQSDSSNNNHPIIFYLEADKTTEYTTGVTYYADGAKATSSAYNSDFNAATTKYTQIEVGDETPIVLHYQCYNHGYMGNAVQVNSNVVNSNYPANLRDGLNVSGTVTATSFVKSGGTSSQYLMADGSVTTSDGGGGGVTVQDEGSALSTTATTLNFVGDGVVASGTGAEKTITISGGGGGSGNSSIGIQSAGTLVGTAKTINFTAGSVSVSNDIASVSVGSSIRFVGVRAYFNTLTPTTTDWELADQNDFAGITIDTNSFYNSSNGRFVIPAGVSKIRVTTSVNMSGGSGSTNVANVWGLYKNGSNINLNDGGYKVEMETGSGFYDTGVSGHSAAISVVENDYIQMGFHVESTTRTWRGFFEIEVLEGDLLGNHFSVINPGVIVQHDGSNVGTAKTINFSTNLDVSAISGGIVTVTASGGDKISEGNTEVETIDTGSDGHIKFTTEGTERVRIDKDGQTTIKSTTNQTLILNNTNTNGQSSIQFQSEGTNRFIVGSNKDSDGNPDFFIFDDTNDEHRFNIKGDGNVGIGSEIPSEKLDVAGTVKATSFVKSGGTSSQYLMADGSTTTSGGGGGVTVQDEGSALSTTATTLNFVGSGVVASGTGAEKTITIAGGASQDVFRTIAVSGQNDVVADSATDTLTLAAGSNMTITTDAGSDTITFASSGGSSGPDSVIMGMIF